MEKINFTAADRAAIAVLDRGLLAAMRKTAKEDAVLFAEFDRGMRKEGAAVDRARAAERKAVIKEIKAQMRAAGIDPSALA